MSLAELMPQVLAPMDAEMAVPLQDELKAHGVRVELGNGIKRITTDAAGNATGVELQNGTVLPGSMVVLGMGVAQTRNWQSLQGCRLERPEAS